MVGCNTWQWATDLNVVLTLIIVDGLLKPHSPGSLRNPATTYLFPAQWSTLPLSFGLLMCIYPRRALSVMYS